MMVAVKAPTMLPQNPTAALGNKKFRQETADERANYADNDIANDPVSATVHYNTGQETGNQATRFKSCKRR